MIAAAVMLRSFRVENHRSIRDEAELSLLPAYDKVRLALPVAAVFGANASGKSNLFDALRWMQEAVRTSFAAWEPLSGVPRHPFRPARPQSPSASTFSVEIVVGEVRHVYGFVVDSERIREEWLFAYPRGKKRVIFERNDDDWTFGSTVARGRTAVLERLTRANALFLSLASRVELSEAMPVYLWFQHQLRCLGANQTPVNARQLESWLTAEPARRSRLVALLRSADLGIVDLRIDDVVGEPELAFLHGEDREPFSLQEESHGTRAWLGLLLGVLDALALGLTLCVDEVDASLHPRLTARLIELFTSTETNQTGAQLIVTTHDATLLGTSFGADILARDEIWFVEKNTDGATALFPLTDFRPRKVENTERRYLGGGYGAIPDVSEYAFRRAIVGEDEVA
jgi:predicted ATPase